jgi:hypothetical protein
LEVNYEIENKDLYAASWFSMRRSPLSKRMNILFLLFSLIVAANNALMAKPTAIARLSAVFDSLILSFLIYAFWAAVICLLMLGSTISGKRNKGVIGWHKITLQEAKLVETTAVNESHAEWFGVDRIEETPNYLFIYVTPTNAHVIPKRAFRSPEEAGKFVRLAKKYHQVAAVEHNFCRTDG